MFIEVHHVANYSYYAVLKSVIFYICEVKSKIFHTGANICTAVVVARSTGTNRPNCEFRVLLRGFAATV
jgi:hypothetical protein